MALAPTTASAAACDDPAHPITGTDSQGVAVGTTKTKTLRFTMETVDGCAVSGASVTVTAPRSTREVSLHQVRKANGFVFWEGSTKIKPRSLKNSDAGTWALTFHARGTDAESRDDTAEVLRASRLSFNAGPEPVEDRTITYQGKLERASWDSHRYLGYRETVLLVREGDPHDGQDAFGKVVTKKNGTYRVTEAYRGPNVYNADFDGTETTAGSRSRDDKVSTPR